MFLVVTTLPLHEGAADECLALFQETNPDLVADQRDWIGAEFTVDRGANTLTVVARWRDPDSYRAYAAGERFRAAMAGFRPFFTGPPEIRVLERLWSMGSIE